MNVRRNPAVAGHGRARSIAAIGAVPTAADEPATRSPAAATAAIFPPAGRTAAATTVFHPPYAVPVHASGAHGSDAEGTPSTTPSADPTPGS